MIKIQRIPAPIELTADVVAKKTALYKLDHTKSVWNEPYIKERLLEMSHGKCCYCECKLGEESKYMEVEHFHDKSNYPDEVVNWNNLLPSCRTCNAAKSDHDTVTTPIVDPSIDDPYIHLGFRDFRYRAKTVIGKETIVLLNLNDYQKHCLPRFEICQSLERKMEDLLDDVKRISSTSKTREKNRVRNNVIELLQECQCNQSYTAIKVTTMLNNPDYPALVTEMKTRNIWTDEMEELDNSMREYRLDEV